MKNSIFTILLLLSFLYQSSGQEWTDLTYDPDASGLENNPFKGFATMWDPNDNFPHSLQGKLFGLKEVMNGIDDFDWTVVENHLNEQALLGKHNTLQFNIDPGIGEYDADGNPVSLIPDYLVDLVEWEFFETTPEFLEATGIPYFNCPDWNDPDLIAAMLNFIEAFGQEYDGDERLFWVQTGLYGMWGEWHIGDVMDVRPEFAMNEANQSLIAQAFLTHFPNSNLVTRFPDNIPTPENFGYSDGLFFTESLDDTKPWYFQTALTLNGADQNWLTLPIGGEVTPQVQDTIWNEWPNQLQWSHEPNIVAQDISTVLESLHPTWLFAHHVLTDVLPGTDEYDNAITTQKMLGYEFYVDKFKLTAENGNPHVEVNIQNSGLAPIYANWDVEFIAVNSANEIIDLGASPLNLNLIQPDVLNNYRTFSSTASLLDNEVYTIKMGVKNPLDAYSADAVQLTFANTTHDINPTKWLTLGDMVLTNGALGTPPVSVSGVNIIEDAVELEIESSIQLNSEVFPLDASNSELTWTSSNPNVLSVDENGVITAGSQGGTVTVTAISNDGAFTDQVEITINPYKLLPAFFEAEDYFAMSGIGTETNNEAEGVNVGNIDFGDWLEYAVKVENQAEFEMNLRVAAQFEGALISLVDPNGIEITSKAIPNTTQWFLYETVTTEPFILDQGEYLLRIVSNGGNFNLNWIEFELLNVLSVDGCIDSSACNYDSSATVDDNSCVFAVGCDECDGNGGVTDLPEVGELCDDMNPNTENDVYTECGICQGMLIEGCTDSVACNFNETAGIDNGSCIYPEGCDECDGNGGVIDNPEVGEVCDDLNPSTENDVYTECGVCQGMLIEGCTDSVACNFNETAGTDNGSCIYPEGCDECDGNGGVIDNPELGELCDDLNPSTENDVYTECSVCQGTLIEGCTDPTYLEFDANAALDNGSCLTQKVYGCVYPSAANYNSLANADDLSCLFEQSCLGDFNHDGYISVQDLTEFLAIYGQECD